METPQVLSVLVILVIVAHVYSGEPFKKKCLKDSTVPEYPVNVYYCYEESKSECCADDLQYTCCEFQGTLLWRNQVIIFGCLAGVVLSALMVYLYIRCENYDCKGPILFKYVLCCCGWREKSEEGTSATANGAGKSGGDSEELLDAMLEERETAAAEAQHAIDVSRPVSQTSVWSSHDLYDGKAIPSD